MKESHILWGPNTRIKLGDENDYMVQVKHMSSFDPRNPDECKEYTADFFENCVDERLQDVWKPVLGCNPPWLSSQDQCNGVINRTDDIFDKLDENQVFSTLSSIMEMKSYPAREKCRPCTVTQSNIFQRKTRMTSYLWSTINLKFATEVVHRTKVLGYSFSQFLIDLGSSLGLWFGLSVFGIADLGIITFHWARNLNVNSFKKIFKKRVTKIESC